MFSLPEGESEIVFVSELPVWWAWAILLALAAALIVCLLLLCRRAAKKRRGRRKSAAESSETPKKKKRWILPFLIALLLLAFAAVAALFFLPGFTGQFSAYRALTALENGKELSASLTVDAEIAGEALHTQTAMERKTVDGTRITRVEPEGVPLYYAGEAVILENGRTYRLGKLFPEYPALLEQIVPLYRDMTFDGDEDVCLVTVRGGAAQTLLQAVVPDMTEQLSETQELTVSVWRENDTIRKIAVTASGTLRDDAQSPFTLSVRMDSIETVSDMDVPQAVIDAADGDTDTDAPVITDDLLRLLSAWARERGKDSASADVTLLADCGPVVLRDSLKLRRQTADGQTVYRVSRGGVTLCWSGGAVTDEAGQTVSGETTKAALAARLPEIAYLACQEGDFTKTGQADGCVYSVRLDADAMRELASVIAPDADRLSPSFQSGTLTVSIRNGEITELSISCSGTVTVAVASVSATVAAELVMTPDAA